MFANKQIQVDNMEVSYIDEGNSKEILLLLHGFSFKIGFTPLIKLLKKDFRVIAPDLPGFGLSKECDIKCTTENYVKFLNKFLEELKIDKVTVFGNSMGGYLSLLFAARFPDRVNKIIVRSPLFTKDQLPWLYRSIPLLFLYENITKNEKLLHYFKSVFFKNYVKLATKNLEDPELFTKIREQQEKSMSLKSARELLFDLARVDLRSELVSVEHETLLLWGKDDGILKVHYACELSSLMPNVSVKLRENETHCIVSLNYADLADDFKTFVKPA